jgi:hypothetical protein
MCNDSPRDGSMLQIRYFPSSSLFLEPLGTIYIMHPARAGVNMKIAFRTDNIWFKNNGLRRHPCELFVHKTGAVQHV